MSDHAPDLSWADNRPLRTATVIYDTRFGKTRTIAEAFADGIRSEGVPVDLLSAAEAQQRPIDAYDLLVIGAPSSHLAASPAMQHFLETLKRMPQLKGHYGFAFDTRVRHHLASAGRSIESTLLHAGLRIPGPAAHAIVEPPRPMSAAAGRAADSEDYRLEDGTLERFKALGALLIRSIRGENEPAS
jgi:flavorubredoxin